MAQRIDAALILGYYRHLLRLPQPFFDTMRVGEITSRVGDAVKVRSFLNGALLNLVLQPLILVFALVAMFFYSWSLALLSLGLIPLNLLVYLAADWLNRRYQRLIMERGADFDTEIAALDPAKTYLVYCRSGNRSAQAVARMRAAGLTALDGGGVEDMTAAGWPTR